jgi:hypothetical protein
MANQWAKSEDANKLEHPELVRESSATTAMPLPTESGSIELVGSTKVGRVVVALTEEGAVVEEDWRDSMS